MPRRTRIFDRMLTAKEVATILGVCRREVDNFVAEGLLVPGTRWRPRGHQRWSEEYIKQWIKNRAQGASVETESGGAA